MGTPNSAATTSTPRGVAVSPETVAAPVRLSPLQSVVLHACWDLGGARPVPLASCVSWVGVRVRARPEYGHLTDVLVQRQLAVLVAKGCLSRSVVLLDPYVQVTGVGAAVLAGEAGD